MPKTKISDAEALARLEQLDTETGVVRDRSAVDDIAAAVRARDEANEAIEAGVRAAREDRVTWVEIGAALGVSHQAAMQRYRDVVTR